jgi:hypothetical protein
MRPTRIWSAKLGKYLPVDYNSNPADPQHPFSTPLPKPSFFQRVNFIDFLFRLFVFVFIFLPMSYLVLAIYFGVLGLKLGFIVLGVFYALIVLCLLSQQPANRIVISLGTIIFATLCVPFVLIGSILFSKAPTGAVLTGGVAADYIRNLFRE